MSVSRRMRILNLSISVILLATLATIAVLVGNQILLNRAQETRNLSFQLAQELRNSSSNLTRFAQTYVATANPKWEQSYVHTLDVRNGKAARPDGRTVPLQTLMEDAGFTAQEFSKLQEAQNLSNRLVQTETEAMNAVKGLFKADDGSYTRQADPDLDHARELMFNDAYYGEVGKIMKPVGQFDQLMIDRTESGVARHTFLASALLGLVGLLTLLLGGLSVFFFRSVNRMLNRVVDQLSNTATQVTQASTQIADSSQLLASSSGEQAASLEETAATMEEISAASRENEQNTRKAQDLSGQTRSIVEESGESVAAMFSTITEMKDASDQTVRIIKTIDEIAFQTNLLSLNAAVEAARAGDAGRGFAVVAEEVRNLALRSAQAAKDTSELLEASANKAQDGVHSVQRVEAKLQETRKFIGEVNDLISEVSSGTTEQLRGVEQVNSAVLQLNEITQTTSANAEEAAGASEELSAQAEELYHLVEELSKAVGRSERPTKLHASAQRMALRPRRSLAQLPA